LRGLEAPVAELFVDGAGHRSPKSDSPVGHPRLGPSPVLSILPRICPHGLGSTKDRRSPATFA
jgi:hypothetical protein